MLTVFCLVCDEPIDDLTEAHEIDTGDGVEYICAVCRETDPAAEVLSGPFGSFYDEVRGQAHTATFATMLDLPDDAFIHDDDNEPY